MIRVLVSATLLTLSACSGVQDQIAQEAAKRAVRPVLAQNFPGVPLEPAVDCVIENARAAELRRLGLSAAQPVPSQETTALVVEIATRPDTLRCLATDGLAPFLQ